MAGWFDPATIELSHDTEEICGLRRNGWFQRDPSAFGTWWVEPIARALDLDIVGLRVEPGQPRSAWPVVRADTIGAVTIASCAAHAVSVLVFRGMVRSAADWDRVGELLDSEWSELGSLNRALGGTGELADLRAVASDPELRDACTGSPDANDARSVALANVLLRLDPDPATLTFCGAAERAMREGAAPPLVEGGAWRGAHAALAFVLERDPVRRFDAAWQMMREPAGLDTCASAGSALLREPDGVASAARVHEAARVLAAGALPAAARSSPWWRAVEALGAAPDPSAYSGLPHMEAAQGLDEAGLPQQAFAALINQGFWSALHFRRAVPQILEAALWLAERHGWLDVVDALRAASGAR